MEGEIHLARAVDLNSDFMRFGPFVQLDRYLVDIVDAVGVAHGACARKSAIGKEAVAAVRRDGDHQGIRHGIEPEFLSDLKIEINLPVKCRV